MENKKGKCILLILFVVSFITLVLLHANDNNLDKFHAIDDAPYNWLVFDYTGKPNLPEMIRVRRPNKLCAGTIFAKTDYKFANNKSKEKSKTGGIVELKGKGKYSGTMKVKIYVNNAEIKTSDVSPITISKDDFKDGKCVKQLDTPKVYGVTEEALSTLKCEFRLAKENSEAVSIDSKTGKTVKK